MNRQIFKSSNAFFFTKQSKGSPKTQCIVRVVLYDDNGIMHLSMSEVSDDDTSSNLNDIYESTSHKSDQIDLTYSMLDFRTCDIQSEQDDKNNQMLHFIRLTTGIFAWKKPPVQFAFKDFGEASSWHSHLLMVIKSNAKSLIYRQTIGYGEDDPPSSKQQQPTIVRKEMSDFQLESFMSEFELDQESEMIFNDVYESTCPADVFQAIVIKTEKSESLGLSGEYWLKVDGDALYLLEARSRIVVQDWPIKSIRKYGLRRDCLHLEAGNACCGGPGNYIFKLIKGDEFMNYFMDAKNKLQLSGKPTTKTAPNPVKSTTKPPPAPPTKPPIQLLNSDNKLRISLKERAKPSNNEYDNPIIPCNLDKVAGKVSTKGDSPPPVYVTAQPTTLNVAQISEAISKQMLGCGSKQSDISKKFKFNS